EKAAANLEFLLKSGLITDPTLSGKIHEYLATRKPGSGPALPPASGRVAFEQSPLLSESLRVALQSQFDGYFRYLDRIGFTKPKVPVTVKIESMDSPNAYYVGEDNTIHVDARMADDPTVGLREYNHHLLGAAGLQSHESVIVESGLADYLSCSYLNDPDVGGK